jgi:hypothetical protein
VVQNTANLLPCVDTRRTPHGNDYHCTVPLPCVPCRRTWYNLFRVSHASARYRKAGSGSDEREVDISLPCVYARTVNPLSCPDSCRVLPAWQGEGSSQGPHIYGVPFVSVYLVIYCVFHFSDHLVQNIAPRSTDC